MVVPFDVLFVFRLFGLCDNFIMSDKKRRARAPNFTQEEVRLLLNLALKERHILENKKTDSESWTLKDQTWNKIEISFNANSGKFVNFFCVN